MRTIGLTLEGDGYKPTYPFVENIVSFDKTEGGTSVVMTMPRYDPTKTYTIKVKETEEQIIELLKAKSE